MTDSEDLEKVTKAVRNLIEATATTLKVSWDSVVDKMQDSLIQGLESATKIQKEKKEKKEEETK